MNKIRTALSALLAAGVLATVGAAAAGAQSPAPAAEAAPAADEAALREKWEQLESRLREIQAARKALEAEKKAFREKGGATLPDGAAMKEKRARLEAAAREAKERLHQLESAREHALKERVGALERERQQLLAAIDRMKAEERTRTERGQKLSPEEQARWDARKAELQEQGDTWTKKRDDLQAEHQALIADKDRLRAALKEAMAALEAFQKEWKEWEHKHREVWANYEQQWKAKAKELEEQARAVHRDMELLKRQIKEWQKARKKVQGEAAAAASHDSKALAQAMIAIGLQELLSSGKITNENARHRLQEVIDLLSGEAKAAGIAADDREALAAVAESLKKKRTEKAATPAELDVLAELQARQGQKKDALDTLRERLKGNPHTKEAYEAALKLEKEQGEHKQYDTFVDGKKLAFDVRPQVKEGRTLMPIRALVEALGATIKWNEETRTVTIGRGDKFVELKIGSDVAMVNGREVKLDVKAEIKDGRTLVPVRFVSEGLGLHVKWLPEFQTIVVTEQQLEEAPAPTQP